MRWRPWYRELGDQLLHALWAGGSVALMAWRPYGIVLGVASLIVLVAREVKQWPPAKDRPFDPLLDLLGYVVGVLSTLWVVI